MRAEEHRPIFTCGVGGYYVEDIRMALLSSPVVSERFSLPLTPFSPQPEIKYTTESYPAHGNKLGRSGTMVVAAARLTLHLGFWGRELRLEFHSQLPILSARQFRARQAESFAFGSLQLNICAPVTAIVESTMSQRPSKIKTRIAIITDVNDISCCRISRSITHYGRRQLSKECLSSSQ